MPNVLLFGCDKELVKRLAQDSRWNVAIGVHADNVSPGLPDPRHWQLVVDDCGKDENQAPSDAELPEIPRYDISERYLEEAERARGIRLCRGEEHCGVGTGVPPGHKILEFNPTASEEVGHLIDFVDEFEGKFHRACLDCEPYQSEYESKIIFRDSYDWPLMVIDEYNFPFLYSIDMVDKDARIDALFYLCQRTVLRLWPEVYSDLFRPRRVVALEQQRADIIARRREEAAEVERKIQEELDFYAPYTNLTWVAHNELKRLVADAFQEVFSFDVEDLDAKLKKGEPKTVDLIIKYGDWSAMVEVRGSSNRNARDDDLENLDDNCEQAKEVHGETDSKLLVFNGLFSRDAEQRRQNPTFSKGVVREAKARDIGLLSAEELLRGIEAYRNGEMPVEEFVEALRSPGLFQPPWEG